MKPLYYQCLRRCEISLASQIYTISNFATLNLVIKLLSNAYVSHMACGYLVGIEPAFKSFNSLKVASTTREALYINR